MGTNRLSAVKKTFRQWQGKHGRGTGYHIPEKMRGRALALLDGHTIDELARELGLNAGTVRKWRRNCQPAKRRLTAERPRQKPPEFIELKAVHSPIAELTIEWVRRDGNRMRLTGCSVSHSREFINEFLRSGETR